MTVRTLLERVEARLTHNARQEALWLCAHAAGVTPAALLAHAHQDTVFAERALKLTVAGLDGNPVSSPAAFTQRALKLAERRASGEPLQYILGTQPFMDFEVLTDKRALIPRPDTETLVNAALECIRASAARTADVLELCTGSGAVAVALARATDAHITATDISADCLALARENARHAGVARGIRFLQGDLFGALTDGARFDVILANPPYVKTADIDTLEPEVRQWEPVAALDGGADGLDFYRRIARDAHAHMKPGGALLLEVGAGQAGDVADILAEHMPIGRPGIDMIKDDNGIERVVCARMIDTVD